MTRCPSGLAADRRAAARGRHQADPAGRGPDVAVVGITALDAVWDGGSFVAVAAGAAPIPLRGIRVRNVWIRPDAARLAALAGLADAGRLTPRVASIRPLGEVADAHRLLAKGGLRGRIVLQPAA
jgi:NADPH:quinone reductase-like Zn-dependent oxidoreductase